MIASITDPIKFTNMLTDISKPVSVPKIVFVELELGELANDPKNGAVADLPYPNIEHLRDCLIGLKNKQDKPSKTIIRIFKGELFYRMCKNGFFVGDGERIIFYKFPSLMELNDKYYVWWRSAINIGFSG